MNNIIFIGAVEGSLNYNRTIDYKSVNFKKDTQIGVRTELLRDVDTDMVGVRFYIRIKSKDNKVNILDYHVTLTFKVDNWQKDFTNLPDKELREKDEVKKMLEITIGFMRGSLFVQEKNTLLEGLNLPIIIVDELLPLIQIITPSSKSSL
jgi:hypothetical protein